MNLWKPLVATLAVGLLGSMQVPSARADFRVIKYPTKAYQNATTPIFFNDPDFTELNSITDNNVTVSFTSDPDGKTAQPLQARTVNPAAQFSTWQTWSKSPWSEAQNPRVLWTENSTSVWLNLSKPVKTFGFEAEPKAFGIRPISADFFDGNTLIDIITLPTFGNGGAKLFALTTKTQQITQVLVSSSPVPSGSFAIGHVRYSNNTVNPVPEQSTLVIGAMMGLVGLLAYRRRQIRAKYAAPLLIALIALCSAGAAKAQNDTVPYDKTWDWVGKKRTIYYTIYQGHGMQADYTNLNADGGRYARVFPYFPTIEPDPTNDNLGFTIGDAFRRAANAWNSANTGWKLVECDTDKQPYPAGAPLIRVRMGKNVIFYGGGAEFDGPPQGSIPPTDNDPDGGNGGGGGPSRYLGYFQRTMMGKNAGEWQEAQIVFNPYVGWSVDDNKDNGILDQSYDPIITALHEIGHGLRLLHTANKKGNTDPGPVMRPFGTHGLHTINNSAKFARNPDANDITGAKNSAKNK